MHRDSLRSAPFEGQASKHVTSDASSWSCAVGALPNSNTHCWHAHKVKERNYECKLQLNHMRIECTQVSISKNRQTTVEVSSGKCQWDHCMNWFCLPMIVVSTVLSALQYKILPRLTFPFWNVQFLVRFHYLVSLVIGEHSHWHTHVFVEELLSGQFAGRYAHARTGRFLEVPFIWYSHKHPSNARMRE